MDKSHPPLSFGVFKPVGHTVIAFRTVIDLESAAQALRDQGFEAAALVQKSLFSAGLRPASTRLCKSTIAPFTAAWLKAYRFSHSSDSPDFGGSNWRTLRA